MVAAWWRHGVWGCSKEKHREGVVLLRWTRREEPTRHAMQMSAKVEKTMTPSTKPMLLAGNPMPHCTFQ